MLYYVNLKIYIVISISIALANLEEKHVMNFLQSQFLWQKTPANKVTVVEFLNENDSKLYKKNGKTYSEQDSNKEILFQI